MKALKEKRISLRSLWRRGLVILSLFALVFASCGDSSSGGGTDSGGLKIVKIEVKDGPANDQYFGQPVDLTGVTLRVWYSDGTEKPVAFDGKNITASPRVITGGVYDDGSCYMNRWYELIYDNATTGSIKLLPSSIEIFQIYRSNSTTGIDLSDYSGLVPWTDGTNIDLGVPGLYDLGLHLTGTDKMTQKTAYVDDDKFDFSGLALEADYVNTAEKKIERKPISFANITWEIKPWMDRAKLTANGAYEGYVLITVGQDLNYSTEQNYRYYDEDLGDYVYFTVYNGVTVMAPLDAVYTVKAKNAIELIGAKDGLTDYFYWEENTRAAWLDRLGPDATLKVTYTNDLTKTFNIQDLAKKSRIYKNSNPVAGTNNEWWDDADVYHGPNDFDIMTIRYPFTKKSADLSIILYYRGGQYKLPVNVYATLLKVEADQSIDFFPDPRWDNDVDNGVGGPKQLAKELKVKAWYQAINDASVQKDYELTYFHADGVDKPYKAGPYYLFAISDSIDDETGAVEDSTYKKGYEKYKTNTLGKGKETRTNVTIRHEMSSLIIAQYYAQYFYGSSAGDYLNGVLPDSQTLYDPTLTNKEAGFFGPKAEQSKKTKVSVNWVNKN